MPTFIIAGYQKSVSNHIKAALNEAKSELRGWRWELFPSKENSESKIAENQVADLLSFAEEKGGAHIFGVNAERQNRNSPNIGGMIKSYFRLRWITAESIRSLASGTNNTFVETIIAAIDEEEYWLSHIKPKSLSSPLILPEIFETTADLNDMWLLSESYNDIGNLRAAARKIEKFQTQHRKRFSSGSKTPWIDNSANWRWEDDGAPHGEALYHKAWKYSFHAPNFHFDVQKNRKLKVFTDCYGGKHNIDVYVNVTVHGEVMSAK